MTTQKLSAKEQFELLHKNVVQITPAEDLLNKLEQDRPLTIKLGCDPSRPDLHLGHAVVLRKLRQFQDLGHKVILIIGDFTGMIGDPTGRSKTRPALSLEETRSNGQTYLQQATLILDTASDKLSVRFNSDWLGKLSFKDVIELAAKYTVARMLEREDFRSRLDTHAPISVHELLYPLAQAFDSVAIRSDVELGGTDQTFNLMVGRDIQQQSGQPPQVVMTMPLLVGTDGKEKMSKSLNNYIALSDPPEVMFTKLMRVPDTQLPEYVKLVTDLDLSSISNLDPVEAHRVLARTVVGQFYDHAAIQAAEARYNQVAGGLIPAQLPQIEIACAEGESEFAIQRLVVAAGLATSNSEARRLIEGKGIKLNDQIIEDAQLKVKTKATYTLQRGKNQFKKIVLM